MAASMEEVKGQILSAADSLEMIVGTMHQLNGGHDMTIAQGAIRNAFEGTGRQDLLEIGGQLASQQITIDDVIVEFMGMVNALRDITVTM